jgi:hypothetical protein
MRTKIVIVTVAIGVALGVLRWFRDRGAASESIG